jgi:DNA-binding transcriptional MerR regulator
MSDLVTIGHFSQITGLSIKALRIYAEEGLLTPAYVDPNTGYRYYSLEQATVAGRIRLLRYLEMPLDDIWSLLHAQDDEAVRDLLDCYQNRISKRIARDQHTLLLLQRLRESKEGVMAYSFETKEVADQPIISIRMRIPPATFAQMMPTAMSELKAHAERQGILCPDKAPMVIQHAYSEEEGDIEACLAVERVVEIEEGKRITSRILAGGPVAYMVHMGPYEELGLIYPALVIWIGSQEYEISGPSRALFWDGPWSVENPELYRTEVVMPIRGVAGPK